MPRRLRNLFHRERQDSPSGKSQLERQRSPTPQVLPTPQASLTPQTSPTPQVPKKSYWDLAALQLQRDEPSIYEALQQMLKGQDSNAGELQAQLSSSVQRQKRTMEERQWTLPFKVRGREVKIRGQLDGILKVLQSTKDIGSALAGLDPIHAGIPWAAVNLIITGALNDSEQHAAALDGLSQILPLVARYAEVELMYRKTPRTELKKDFEKCLVTLYASVLKYQVSAGCHCQKNTFVRFLRAIPKLDAWGSMLQDIKSNDSKCKEFTTIFDSLDQRVANCDLQNLLRNQEEKMAEYSRKLDELVDDKRQEENSRILQWICREIPGKDHQDILVTAKMGSQYKDSGRWLFKNPAFKAWMAIDGLQGPPFWLWGSVGMGKTSLVCRVIEWCIENTRNHSTGHVAYFYCSGKKGQLQAQGGTDPETILRSLIRQFAWNANGDIASPVSNMYKRMNGERPQGAEFSLEESAALLAQLIDTLPDTTIIIDALDECAQPYKLLRALKSLRSYAVGRIRLFVSGRNHVDVSSVIEDCRGTGLGHHSTMHDIHSFIFREVKYGEKQLLRGNEPVLEDRLIETLSTRAQGNFRWVELQLATFMDENFPLRLPKSVSDKLDLLDKQVGIPDLMTVYDEIYRANVRASDRDERNAKVCYQMVLGKFTPLLCSEIAKAVALNDDGSFDPNVDEGYILAICSNLLILDNWGYLQFAHLSVVEYLGRGSFDGMYSDERNDSMIAEICLTYVTSLEYGLFDPTNLESINLEEYATWFWPIHCKELSANSRRTKRLISLIRRLLTLSARDSIDLTWLMNLDLLSKFDWVVHSRLDPRDHLISREIPDPVFAICALGYAEFIDEAQSFLEKAPARLEAQTQIGFTPLMVAIINNEPTVVKALLRYKIDLERKTDLQETGLMLAVQRCNIEIVNLLLENGADIHTTNAGQRSLLNAVLTSTEGNKARRDCMSRLLLGTEINIESRDDMGKTALMLTAQRCDIEMFNILLENGANIQSRDSHQNSLLHAVLRNFEVDRRDQSLILRLLLEKGLDIETENDFGDTPLFIAIVHHYLDLVQLLLDADARTAVSNLFGETPLIYAARSGNQEVILLILKHTSSSTVVLPDWSDRSALTRAALNKDAETLKLLVTEIPLESVENLRSADSIQFYVHLRLLKSIDSSLFDLMWYDSVDWPEDLRKSSVAATDVPVRFWRHLRGQSNTDEDLSCEPPPKKPSLSRAKSAEWWYSQELSQKIWSQRSTFIADQREQLFAVEYHTSRSITSRDSRSSTPTEEQYYDNSSDCPETSPSTSSHQSVDSINRTNEQLHFATDDSAMM